MRHPKQGERTMRYLVVGATSETGNAVVARLARREERRTSPAVRSNSQVDFLGSQGAQLQVGDVSVPEDVRLLVRPLGRVSGHDVSPGP